MKYINLVTLILFTVALTALCVIEYAAPFNNGWSVYIGVLLCSHGLRSSFIIAYA